MTYEQFSHDFIRLEVLFNEGRTLEAARRNEYYDALRYYDPADLTAAVNFIARRFHPVYNERFPSIATVMEAIFSIKEASLQPFDAEPEIDPGALDFCQRCHNRGFYLGEDDVAHPCVCEKGRLCRAAWGVPIHEPDRQAKIQAALDRLPPSAGPVRGLQEKVKGIWQDTDDEHGWKCVALQLRYELMRRRRKRQEEAGAIEQVGDAGTDEALEAISEARHSADDDVPF
jgi:hypothetical protein